MSEIVAWYNGVCTSCGGAILKGTLMGISSDGKRKWCQHCLKSGKDRKTLRLHEAVLLRYNI